MWTPLAVVALLTLGQAPAEQLSISDVQPRYGELGPARSDNKLLPNDRYYVVFRANGFKVDDEGKILYAMKMQVTNEMGKTVYGQDALNYEMINTLGGNSLPIYTYVTAGSQPPGEYTLNVTIVDRRTKAQATLTRKFEILRPAFGIVAFTTSYDASGNLHSPAGGVVGQHIWINFGVVGFERDKTKKQPNIYTELRMLDESGKPTTAKPLWGRVNADVDPMYEYLPMQFLCQLNRSGKFTVELIATDEVSKKTTKLTFPLTVTEPKASDDAKQK